MNNVLHLPARPDAPIACDMTTALDTPGERLAEYGRLFATALVRRERRDHAVGFVFRATPGTREHVEDLARREAACCPFMGYRVETLDDEVSFTFTNPAGRAEIDAILDAVYALFSSSTERTSGTGRRLRPRARASEVRWPSASRDRDCGR